MKSKPYVFWLILGAVALGIWLLWPFGKAPSGGQPVPVRVKPGASADSAPAAVASATRTPGPGSSASVPAPGLAQPSGATPAVGGSTIGQVNGTPVATLNPGEPGAPNQVAQTDAVRVRRMISDYHTLMGENPVGTNAEIMKQMTGGNARQATLGPPDGIPLNAQGELLDQWGTPYFFHQLSRDKMEIRSAGPDKVMWTGDDVIAR